MLWSAVVCGQYGGGLSELSMLPISPLGISIVRVESVDAGELVHSKSRQ
jgi:hypothetical protein